MTPRTRHSTFARFVALSTFGFVFFGLFTLTFAPRTSVRRDLRRFFQGTQTEFDVKRSILLNTRAENIRENSLKYTAEPHLAGTNKELAEWTRDQLQSFGWDAGIEEYEVYLNYPLDHALNLVDDNGKVIYEASLEEDVLKEDPTTGLRDRVPTFHGYSANGNVTAQFVYANYGEKGDYDLILEKTGDPDFFKGKIVITRYGGIFRGLKVKFAQDLGAKGVVIYSDPGDDSGITPENGYKTYPKGPARNPSSVQRGSVQFLSLGPGDPTTPGYPSKGAVERQDPSKYIPSIPSLPVSYRDILPILKELNGRGETFDGFEGGLEGVDYSIGPSKTSLNLYNSQDYKITPIYNVIASLTGSTYQNEAIVVGNHRDAWIAGGAADPNSGSAVLLELARVLGVLSKAGWTPTRTLTLASWDAEEYGLVGSTEWGEDHSKYISDNVLAYVNLDVAVSGSKFHSAGSPVLSALQRAVAKEIPHPSDNNTSLYDVWKKDSRAYIGNLGSGSDYTVFLDHLGVPSIDVGFSGGKGDPVYQYHSNYDSFHWMDNFVENAWEYHAAISKYVTLFAVSLSEREVVAFNVKEYALTLSKFLKAIQRKYVGASGHLSGLETESNEQKVLEKDNSGFETSTAPWAESFDDVLKTAKEFVETAHKYDEYTSELQKDIIKDWPWYKYYKKLALLARIRVANRKLFHLEKLFLSSNGLQGREWFKHIVYAPGRYTGYAGEVFPGIVEALEDGDYENAIKWLSITKASLKSAKGLLK